MTRIELREVSKYFHGSVSPSVDNVSLSIDDGELLCLLGPSGCGKSTTLRMIAGLETISSGVITVRGNTVDDYSEGTRVAAEDRNLGLVFQNYALWPHLTVRKNVSFGPEMQKLSKNDRKARVGQALRTLAIEEYAERYPSDLSGGQQQRVAIARALAAEPTVLLLDEPLSNLDARLRMEMRAEFQRIHRDLGTTMVFVTHDQWEAVTMATRIVVMNKGRIEQTGTPLEIYETPQTRFVAEFMGSPSINIIETASEFSPASQALHQWLEVHNGTHVASAGIRPESFNLSPSAADVQEIALRVPVKVTSVIPTGGTWITEVHAGEHRLCTTTTRRPSLSPGDDALLSALPDDIHLFSRLGQRVELTERTLIAF